MKCPVRFILKCHETFSIKASSSKAAPFLLPVITVLIGWFISIFSGSLIIEQMFALNGMGQLYYQGLMNNDFELALAIQMFYVLIALVGQLITDLSYGIVDPRVRVNK